MTQAKRTEFALVARAAGGRVAGRTRSTAWLVAAALVAAAGIVAAANLTVNQRHDTASLYAERFNVAENFLLEESKFYPAHAFRSGVGTLSSPEEMTIGMADVRTDLLKDQWVYTVLVKETGVNAITSGEYSVELTVDGTLYGVLFFKQATNNPTAVEGVRASFAIGSTLSPSALYYVVVKPVLPPENLVSFTFKSQPGGDLTWIGVGGDVEGLVNPAITVPAGATLRLTGQHGGDGTTPHNIGILRGDGSIVDPPRWSPTFNGGGQEKTIQWTAVAGSYTYNCEYHSTMSGVLTVA